MAKKNNLFPNINKGKKINLSSTNKWAANALKSLGISTVSMMTELMPATAELVSGNSETVTNLVKDLRNMKTSSKRLMGALTNNDYIKIGMQALADAKSDLKSGKFVNTERENRLTNAALGFDEDDLDMDFGDDDGSYSFSDDDGNTTNVIVSTNIDKDNPMVQATVQNSQAIIAGAQAVQKTNVAIANNQMIMSAKSTEAITNELQAINQNVTAIVQFNNDNLSKFTAASLSYYQDSIGLLTSMKESLEKLATPTQGEEKKASSRIEEGLFNNTFDLTSYGEVLKKNFKAYMDDSAVFSTIKPILEDKNMLKSMLASPLSFIPSMIVSKALPQMMKKSFEALDKNIKEFFPALLMKWGSLKDSSNPLVAAFGKIFGLNTKTRESVDLAAYHKGPTPFDGQTKHAITNLIPMYLRKILSALTAKSELVMDWDKGELIDSKAMKDKHDSDLRYARYGGISDIESKLMTRLERFEFSNRAYREELQKDIRGFLDELLKSDKFVNINKRKDEYGFDYNPLTEIKDLGSSKNRFLLALIDSLSQSEKMRLFGSGRVAARQNVTNYFEQMDQSPNAFGLFGDKSKEGTLYKSKLFNQMAGEDKYGLTANKYLRDIRDILIKGIIVFPQKRNLNASASHLSQYRHSISLERELRESNNSSNNQFERDEIRDSLVRDRIRANTVDDVLDSLGDSQLTDTFRAMDADSEAPTQRRFRDRGFGRTLNAISDILAKPQAIIAKGIEKVNTTLYNIIFPNEKVSKPNFFVRAFESLKMKFDSLGDFMEGKFFGPMRKFLWEGKDSVWEKFKNSEFMKSAKEKWEGAKNYLFGTKDGEGGRNDDGLFSDVYKQMRSQMFQIRNYITGAGYIDPVTGVEVPRNEDSVLGHAKTMIGQFTGTVKEYLFGKEGDPDIKGTLGGAISAIKSGFQSFGDAIFGTHKDKDGNSVSNFSVDDFVKETKKHAPKALATGLIGAGVATFAGGGLLPSLFLPTGPVGGAIIGTTVGFLSQSDSFMNAVFGKKDENGERMGGFVSKKTQDFFKKHKTALIGGAAIGTLKGLFLPQMGLGILPGLLGGPISGAVLALGTSLLTKSEGFKKLMFGDADEDGNRKDGLVGKIVGKFKGANGENNKFGKIGAGILGGSALGLIASKFGIVGATLLGGGPLMGALLGAASGIALSSEKFKKAIFGEWDEDKQIRQGGLFGKFANWAKLEIFGRMKLKLEEIGIGIHQFFLEKVANPFSEAIAPMKQAFKDMTDAFKQMFINGWEAIKKTTGDIFERFVGEPFGTFMEEKVMKPLRGFMNKLIAGTGRILGGIITAPFKALTFMANSVQGRHERNAVRGAQQENTRNFIGAIGDLINFRKKKEDKRSIWKTGAEMFASYWSKDKKEQIKGERIGYYTENEELKKKNKENTDRIINKKKAEHQAKVDRLQWQIAQAKGQDYETAYIDKDGNFKYVDYDIRDAEDIAREAAYNERNANNNATEFDEPTPSGNDTAIIDDTGGWTSIGRRKKKKQDETAIISTGAEGWTSIKGKKSNRAKVSSPSLISDAERNRDGFTSIRDRVAGGKYNTAQAKVSGNSGSSNITHKDSKSLLGSIAKDVRSIASEIHGQLDGLGGNVYKIRRIFQKKEGISDEDISGSANKDRQGFFGKLRAFMYKPFEKIGDFLAKPLHAVQGAFANIAEKAASFGKFLWELPGNIAKGVVGAFKEVYGGIKFVLKAIATVPMVMLEAGKIALKTIGEAVIPVIAGIGSGIGQALAAVGAGIGEAFKESIAGLGHILGGLGKGVGHLLAGIGSIIPTLTGALGTAAQMLADGALTFAKISMEGILHVFGGVVGLATMPFKAVGSFVGNRFNKLAGLNTQHVMGTVGLNDDTIDRLCECINSKALYREVLGIHREMGGAPKDLSENSKISDVAKAGDDGVLGDTSANAMLSAMRANDAIEDDQKAREAQKTQEQAQRDAARAEATDQTAEARMRYLAQAEEVDDEKRFKTELLANTRQTAESTSKHGSAWGKIFSKNGLITTALIGLPLLLTGALGKIKDMLGDVVSNLPSILGGVVKTAFDFMRGENSKSRTDADGTKIENKNSRERENKLIYFGASHLTSKYGVPLVKKVGSVVKFASKPFKWADKKLGKVFFKAGENAIENPAKGLTGKILEIVKNKVTLLLDKAKSKLPKGKVSQIATSIINFIKEKLGPLITNNAHKFEQASLQEVGKKINFVVTGIFALYDSISGAYEVRRIFQLPANFPVTGWMRVCSAIVKMLVNFSPIIALIATLMENMFDVSFYKELGGILIRLGENWGDKSADQVAMGQAQFLSELDAFNKEHGTSLSAAAYNDKINKTMWDSLVKDPLGIVKNGATNLFNAGKTLTGNIIKFAGDVGNGIIAGGKGLLKTGANIAGSAVMGTLNIGKDILGGGASLAAHLVGGFFKSMDYTFGFLSGRRDEKGNVIPLTDAFKPLRDAKEKIANVFSTIGKSFGDIGNRIKDWITSIPDRLHEFFFGKPDPLGVSAEHTGRTPGAQAENASRAWSSGDLVGSGGVPYFSQNDPRWKNNKVGNGSNMGDAGCGPTAMAMAANALGRNVNPAQLQDFSNKGGFSNNGGTHGSFIGASASAMGIRSQQVLGPTANAIESGVKRGPMVLLGRSGGGMTSPYTSAGHYVVATDAGNGNVRISDPRSKALNKTMPIKSLGGTMAAWTFSGAGETAGEKVARLMSSLEGKLKYTQSGQRDNIPGGWGDCSSTVRWCYKTALGIDVGSYTGEQLNRGAQIVAGHGKHSREFFAQPGILDRLAPGDLILFGTSRTNIGSQHVEMYLGNGRMSGHGGGANGEKMGPLTKSVHEYYHRSPVLEVRRYCDSSGKPINSTVPITGQPQDIGDAGSANVASSGSSFKSTGNFFTDLGNIVTAATSQLFGFDKMGELTSKIAKDLGLNMGMSENPDGNPDPTKLVANMQYSKNPNINSIVNRSLLNYKPITASQINTFIEQKRVAANPARNSKSPFRNMGQAFIDAGRATGLDPRYILAHAIEESADGTSNIARTKGNYFGINAIDSNPNAAYSFGTDVASNIMTGAKWIKSHYTDKGNDSLYKMLHNSNPGPYASNPAWATNIAGIMAPMEDLVGAGNGFNKSTDFKPVKVSNNLTTITRKVPTANYGNQTINIRGKGDSEYNQVLSEILQVLRSIDANTGAGNTDMSRLVDILSNINSGAERTKAIREVVEASTGRGPRQYESNDMRMDGYSRAKLIAKGKVS
nr:MAG TPA: Beta- N-acetylglucosaminidase [Caudoviricetes sp.]